MRDGRNARSCEWILTEQNERGTDYERIQNILLIPNGIGVIRIMIGAYQDGGYLVFRFEDISWSRFNPSLDVLHAYVSVRTLLVPYKVVSVCTARLT